MAKKLFQKGNKGGPGRPKGSGAGPFCRAIIEKEGAFERLADIAFGRQFRQSVNVIGKGKETVSAVASPELQLEALKVLFAYGYGKPPQMVTIEGGEAPVQIQYMPALRKNEPNTD